MRPKQTSLVVRRQENIRRSFILIVVIPGLLSVGPASAQQQPSQQPMLRLETGTHTAPIRAVATDAAGKFLATVSDDKTLRLWMLATGERIQILRPPIGPGSEGELKAVALSPDAQRVVTGGWTGYTWENANSFYVFETATGRLVRRVGGLPQIYRLAWSPDGSYVAAGLAGANGVRLFATTDWHEVGRDADYAAPIYGLSFDAAGRLAVSAFDGYIRLYGTKLRPLAKAKAPSGTRPYGVAPNPDGSALAVGYNDALAVDILSVPDLRRVGAASVAGLTGGTLSQVAWSREGALLAGGTHWSAATGSPIFRWADSHWAKRTTLTAADATLTGIVPLAGGGFAYATADPTFGRYDAQLNRVLDRPPDIADFRGQIGTLRLSADGMRVSFGLEKGGGKPHWFDADARRLIAGNPPADMRPADTDGLAVGDWRNGSVPRLSGKPLTLKKNETSRSLAIAPDRRSFVLGTDWYLRRFGADGGEVWSAPLPAPAWAIGISADGRLAAAALGNGTIGWYRYADGLPLLSLFMTRDGTRWVLWTPDGYYDASAGREDLIGWHVNRGPDQAADWVEAGQLRDRYYRPELVATVLHKLDLEQGSRETSAPTYPSAPSVLPPEPTNPSVPSVLPLEPTNPSVPAVLPPVVRIVSPSAGESVSAPPLEIRYSVRSPSGAPITGVRLSIDGLPAKDLDAGPVGRDVEREGIAEVPLETVPSEENTTLSLVATIGDLTSAQESVKIRVVRIQSRSEEKAGAQIRTQAREAPKPTLRVLAIGVSRYRDPGLVLSFAAADANDVADALRKQQGGIYGRVSPLVLRDDDATLLRIEKELDRIFQEASGNDVTVVFMAGYGTTQDNKYYFLPVDVDVGRLQQTAESQDGIREKLSRIRGIKLFFFDTCQSGKARLAQPDITGVVNDLIMRADGVVVFAATEGREVAYEEQSWVHGAFTQALLEALNGRDGGHQEITIGREITIAGLKTWLSDRVKELTKDRQHPSSPEPSPIRDRAIARVQ